ncbi:sigma-70 family RNA polymerase sigma factor [Sutcliffiella cohnii]|uniref:RNA polymerase sigma factor n=1 Tax=Sutcliffiella cohnii TaxID=33932 RepID=UPI002E1A2838|nr:sigma-70 family RNA polymerase sigma factor [Sutcliffiella cohnii]
MDINSLYKEMQPKIYAFFYIKTSNKEAAEDLTQEVFFEAIKGGVKFSGESSIQTWLFAIAKNRLKKYYRSNKYKWNLLKKIPRGQHLEASPEQDLLAKESKFQLLEKIEKLDDEPKEVVILRMYGELSFKEIGSLLGISENVARVTFHRAKLKLQKELEGYYVE